SLGGIPPGGTRLPAPAAGDTTFAFVADNPISDGGSGLIEANLPNITIPPGAVIIVEDTVVKVISDKGAGLGGIDLDSVLRTNPFDVVSNARLIAALAALIGNDAANLIGNDAASLRAMRNALAAL